MNNDNDLFFDSKSINEILKIHKTPFHIYSEEGIRINARKLNEAFSWSKGFKNYFAVKACPNPYILEILKEENFGADCSSLPELIISERAGILGENIMFTSNNTPEEEFKSAFNMGSIINLDDLTHIEFLEKYAGIPEIICFRYNPGPLRKTDVGNVIGNPESAKYGLTKEQLFIAYNTMKQKGVSRFGIHTMIASNELDPNAFIETARMLFDLILEISIKLEISFEFVNFGGGIGIPYKPEQKSPDINYISEKVHELYKEKIENNGLPQIKIFMENGRAITGPYGYLITKAIHEKHIYKEYIGVDASMANLMRPGMYGSYHHITVLGKENAPRTRKYDIVGSLCENNDKFAIDRILPEIKIGDILAIHNTGAHGYSMGFNYNGKLRSKELLLKKNGSIELIRRAETLDDYMATFKFPAARFKMVD